VLRSDTTTWDVRPAERGQFNANMLQGNRGARWVLEV